MYIYIYHLLHVYIILQKHCRDVILLVFHVMTEVVMCESCYTLAQDKKECVLLVLFWYL